MYSTYCLWLIDLLDDFSLGFLLKSDEETSVAGFLNNKWKNGLCKKGLDDDVFFSFPVPFVFSWQYFGTNIGLIRLYPGREWDTNFAGFYNDYDPRIRPW